MADHLFLSDGFGYVLAKNWVQQKFNRFTSPVIVLYKRNIRSIGCVGFAHFGFRFEPRSKKADTTEKANKKTKEKRDKTEKKEKKQNAKNNNKEHKKDKARKEDKEHKKDSAFAGHTRTSFAFDWVPSVARIVWAKCVLGKQEKKHKEKKRKQGAEAEEAGTGRAILVYFVFQLASNSDFGP